MNEYLLLQKFTPICDSWFLGWLILRPQALPLCLLFLNYPRALLVKFIVGFRCAVKIIRWLPSISPREKSSARTLVLHTTSCLCCISACCKFRTCCWHSCICWSKVSVQQGCHWLTLTLVTLVCEVPELGGHYGETEIVECAKGRRITYMGNLTMLNPFL